MGIMAYSRNVLEPRPSATRSRGEVCEGTYGVCRSGLFFTDGL
jgi:hypothetical protein